MRWNTLVIFLLGAALGGCDPETPSPEAPPIGALPSGMRFVAVPAGEFMMGSPEDEAGRSGNEGPQRTVRVEAFELMDTPVTWGMWMEVMGEDSRIEPPPEDAVEEHPVTGVTWYDAWRFLERLHQADPDHLYLLPSEAQWEYACRAGTLTPFFWGAEDSLEVVGLHAWFWANSEGSTQPAGLKAPNPWGLYDMSGNVFEWCHDTWCEDYSRAGDCAEPREDPRIPFRVVRGGSWRSDPHALRSAYRFAYRPEVSGLGVGFRAARTPR